MYIVYIMTIILCYNKNCNAGKNLIHKLFELGLRNIVEFDEGIEGYRMK